jgi:hypothetical protein
VLQPGGVGHEGGRPWHGSGTGLTDAGGVASLRRGQGRKEAVREGLTSGPDYEFK